MRRGIGDGETVAGLACFAVERNQRGKAGRVDALGVFEIERDILPHHKRFEFPEKLLLPTSDELLDTADELRG